MGLGRNAADWKEGTVIFSGLPIPNCLPLGTGATIGSTAGWYGWDATALVADWHKGVLPNYGVCVTGPGSGGLYSRRFMSREGGSAPRLVVKYYPPTPTPTADQHFAADQDLYPHADRQGVVDSHTHTDTATHEHADGHNDPERHAHADCNLHADLDANHNGNHNGHALTHVYAYLDADGVAHQHADYHTYSDLLPDALANMDDHFHRAHTHAYSDPNTDRATQCHTDA